MSPSSRRPGLYDAVISYDALDRLVVRDSAVLVDFAGNAELLRDLYARLPGRLAHVLRVGVTHHEVSAAEAGALPGPRPVWFFAPDAATALIRAIGPEAFDAALAECWAGFVAAARTWVTVEQASGAEALQRVWRDQLAGRARPDRGYIAPALSRRHIRP